MHAKGNNYKICAWMEYELGISKGLNGILNRDISSQII